MVQQSRILRSVNWDGPRPGLLPEYQAYRSPHSPSYKIQPNFKGITTRHLGHVGVTLGLFGAAAGVAALFFVADIPRVRNDIMIKIPFIGSHFKREIAPEDNPF